MRADSATQSALVSEAPPSPEHPRGLALCLSGGGFRALLFHLGALRRLNELGVLARVDTLSATSGGSILAARLATLIAKEPTKKAAFTPEAWDELVQAPLLALTREDLQRGFRTLQLLARNLFRPHARVEALAKRYEEILTPLKLRDLPPAPRFVFCATDFLRSVPWTFERDRMEIASSGGHPLPRPPPSRAPLPPRPAFRAPSALSRRRSTPLFSPAARRRPDRPATRPSGASPSPTGRPTRTWASIRLEEPHQRPRLRSRRVSEARPRQTASPLPPTRSPYGIDSEGQEIRRRRLVSGFVGGQLPAPSGASPVPPRAIASPWDTPRSSPATSAAPCGPASTR